MSIIFLKEFPNSYIMLKLRNNVKKKKKKSGLNSEKRIRVIIFCFCWEYFKYNNVITTEVKMHA